MKNLIPLLFLIFLVKAHGGPIKIDKNELKNRRPGLTSKGVQRRLMRANEFMAKGNRAEAIKILEGMTSKANYRPFEMGKVWQTIAYAYAQSEKYPQARNAFQKSIETSALPYRPTLQSLFALAQLQVMAEKYGEAEKNLSQWFALTDKPNPDAYVFMATIAYHKKEKDRALELILKGLALSKNPKENWLVFAVSLLYEKERYKDASEFLYKLVNLNHTKKMYWRQLAGTLLNNGNGLHALSVLKLALMQKLLTEEGEILNIASLYIGQGLPFEASELLERAMSLKAIKKSYKNQKLYANCLIQAKEFDKALGPLEKAAALSKDGKLYALKARLFLEKEEYKEALKQFNLSLQKGLDKKDRGQVLVEKGIALIQLKDFISAKTTLDEALKYKDSQKLAQNWRSYIEKL